MIIDSFYCINLNKHYKNWDRIVNEFNCKGLKAPIRVEGVDKDELQLDDIVHATTMQCRYFCTWKMIAISLSHMKAWKQMIANDETHAVICEDDVHFRSDIAANLKAMRVPDEYDLIFLGCFGCVPEKRGWLFDAHSRLVGKRALRDDIKEHNNNQLKRSDFQMGTHCYILSKKGAKALLNFFETKIDNHIDVQIQRLNATKRINVYKTYPLLAFQSSSKGDQTMFPKLLNSVFANIEIEKGVSVPFCFSMPAFEILSYSVTMYTAIFILLGIGMRLYDVQPATLAIVLILLFSVDDDYGSVFGTAIICCLAYLLSGKITRVSN